MHFQTYNILVLTIICRATFCFLNVPYCIPNFECKSPLLIVFQTITRLPASSNEISKFQHVLNNINIILIRNKTS